MDFKPKPVHSWYSPMKFNSPEIGIGVGYIVNVSELMSWLPHMDSGIIYLSSRARYLNNSTKHLIGAVCWLFSINTHKLIILRFCEFFEASSCVKLLKIKARSVSFYEYFFYWQCSISLLVLLIDLAVTMSYQLYRLYSFYDICRKECLKKESSVSLMYFFCECYLTRRQEVECYRN